MRTNLNLTVGQVWQSNDRRRLYAFRIVDVGGNRVLVESVYPLKNINPIRSLAVVSFTTTGTKGYARVS